MQVDILKIIGNNCMDVGTPYDQEEIHSVIIVDLFGRCELVIEKNIVVCTCPTQEYGQFLPPVWTAKC